MRYHFGPFTLDARRRRLYRGEEIVPLAPKGLDTLLILIERAGALVEKEELIEQLWPDTIVTDANLTQHVFTLRKALGDESYIVTVPRRGYRFVTDVTCDQPAAPQRAARETRVGRFTITLPDRLPAARLTTPMLALSPDGTELIYGARGERGTLLCRRALDRLDAEPIAGTDGASTPFWSPDGEWIAFASNGRLWRLRRAGGEPQTLTDAPDCRGALWRRDDSIVYAPGPAEGLWTVHSDGTGAQPLTQVNFEAGERTHRWPAMLPDGRIVFTIGSAGAATFDEAALAIVDSRSGERQTWLSRASDPRSTGDGSVTFLRDGAVWRVRGDGEHAALLLDGVAIESTGIAHYAIAGNGLTVHMPGGRQPTRRELVWADRKGTQQPLGVPAGEIEEPRLSPDGQRIAFGSRAGTSDIWVFDMRRGACMRATSDGDNFAAIWTPDGEALTFSSNRLGCGAIFVTRADGSAQPQLLVRSEHDLVPGSWSPDGERLLYTEYNPKTGADIWMVSRSGGEPQPVLVTPFNEYAPAWSPDGAWFAFTADDSGAPQIYIRRFTSGTKVQASVHGGSEPVWPRGADRLYFRSGDNLVASRVTAARTCDVSPSEMVLAGAGDAGTMAGLPNYYVIGRGERIVIVRSQPRLTSSATLIVTVPLTP